MTLDKILNISHTQNNNNKRIKKKLISKTGKYESKSSLRFQWNFDIWMDMRDRKYLSKSTHEHKKKLKMKNSLKQYYFPLNLIIAPLELRYFHAIQLK